MVLAFLYVAGVQVKYDLSQPNGNRVEELKLRNVNSRIPSFEAVNKSRSYDILVSTYMAEGGDGYSMLATDRLDYKSLGEHCLYKQYPKYTKLVIT